jgi:purine-binding chemotaxis protein CheW
VVLNLDFLTSDDRDSADISSTPSREGELCLRFNVPSGNEFALPASGIREVMSVDIERITPIPNVSPFLLGTFNWRGQVIWVGDLGQFLGDQILVNTNQNEITMLIAEDGETVMGFVVDTVANTEWLDDSPINADRGTIPPTMRAFIKGVYHTTGETSKELRLLDRVAILRSSRWAI